MAGWVMVIGVLVIGVLVIGVLVIGVLVTEDLENTSCLPASPFPHPERHFFIQRMPRLLQRQGDLAAVMRFMRDDIPQKRRWVRLEPFDPAFPESAFQHIGDGLPAFDQLFEHDFFGDLVLLYFFNPGKQFGLCGFQPHEPHVVQVRELLAHAAPFGRSRVAEMRFVDGFCEVQVDAVVDVPGFNNVIHIREQMFLFSLCNSEKNTAIVGENRPVFREKQAKQQVFFIFPPNPSAE